MRIIRKAYAKVNLALSVGPALPAGEPGAGMHPIASWMHSIDLCDEVAVEPLGAGPSRHEIVWDSGAPRRGPIDWPVEEDLGVRAHRVMEREAGRALPVALRVAKRIPAGGGLGGGSADAAAVLMGVNEAFGLEVRAERLAEVSRVLGSDVAFFLDEGAPAAPAVVEGLGERVERVARSAGWVVLVIPGFGCPTGAVYRAFDALPGARLDAARVRGLAGARAVGAGLFNDLEAAAGVVEPRLAEVMARVREAAGRGVVMSGSGSTVVIPAADQHAAGAIGAKVRALVPDVTVVDVRLV